MNGLINLLEEANPILSNLMTWGMLGIVVVAFVVMLVFQNRRQKKQQQEQQDTVSALRPGNKVKTIGGVCGIVVEVNKEENTFVLETGNELNGKSYMKFDMQAIFQTDAKPEPKTETKTEEKADEFAAESTDEKAE